MPRLPAIRQILRPARICDVRAVDRSLRTNWAHCDGVSTWLIAASIANRPELMTKLPRWTKSKNRWKRRAAAVSLIQEAKQGRNSETIFQICGLLRDDPDDMVRKGVGWLLKETYPKRPREVIRFLDDWRASAPRLVLRLAAEKMTAEASQVAAQRVTFNRRTPCGSRAASISRAVFPLTGCRNSGAISEKGSRTKRRCAMRGCGT